MKCELCYNKTKNPATIMLSTEETLSICEECEKLLSIITDKVQDYYDTEPV